ncbi:NfeD family protein [Paenibacillus sp.]|uniref:NfeD family protein n=1 Tax=Paenibacillus sp. TaxID=58172 RepID=UPI002D5E7E66|nr:NfeD family protein [Paenibacillus sp.]HZG84692.1 NfeD family protein [Paenibacillus sp.]
MGNAIRRLRGRIAASLLLAAASAFAFGAAGAASAGEAATAQTADGRTTDAGTVAVIPVDRTVEAGLQRFLTRALGEAEAMGADTVVLVIDTFGGRLDAATEIGEEIRQSPLRTVAYVEGKAISAGSYIALNADEIYMQEGSTLGAAAIVDGSGERVRDSKIVSVWVQQMRSAAQRAGRDPDIAEGMVDDTVRVTLDAIGKVKEPGDLITLSAKDAAGVGYAEGVVATLDEVLATIQAERVERIEPTLAEEAARFLTHPATQTILLVLGVAGLLIELLVPGFGAPGIVGVASFGLYFLGNFIAGFAGTEHIALFVAGIALLVLELFIPSFGILGILGSASLIAGVVLAAYDTGDALRSLGIAAFVGAAIAAVFVRYFKHRGVWNRFILRDALKTEEGYVSHETRKELVGQNGTAATPLRPSGIALVGGQRIDVVTNGEFIPAGADVAVVDVDGMRVVVKEVPPQGDA